MSGFIIHIGAPRTCSTVLQKHLFPKAKTKLVFSKRPFHSSAISEKVMIKRSGTVSAFIKDCLNNYQSNKDFNKYEFSENLLLPLTLYSAYSENNPLKSISLESMHYVIDFMHKLSLNSEKNVLISSERLLYTFASFMCKSFHHKQDQVFPIYPLCEAIKSKTKEVPNIILILREPISFLRSIYLRTLIQRQSVGAKFISADEYISNQAILELSRPGTSTLSLAMHSKLLKQLERYANVKALGFKEIISSKDIFTALGIEGEYKYKFENFPIENKLPYSKDQEIFVAKKITKSLKESNLYESILNSQLFE